MKHTFVIFATMDQYTELTAQVESAPLIYPAKAVEVKKPVRRRRARKAATPAVAPAAAAPVQVIVQNGETGTKKRKGRKRKLGGFCIPIEQCVGTALYEGKNSTFFVAIYKTGVSKGRTWYKLLFVSDDYKWAHHSDFGGFFGKAEKLSEISMF